jgi:hypothetical protein
VESKRVGELAGYSCRQLAQSAGEGNKLTVAFDKAGEQKVIDTFVERG